MRTGGMKSAQLPGSIVTTLGNNMVKSKLDAQHKAKRGTSANSAHYKELPTTHWAHAVAMLAAKNEPAVLESNKQLPEDFSTSDCDVIRARELSS